VTPFLAWLKRTVERAGGRWYEGPEPPARLAQHVALFAENNPRATVSEWAAFAAEHAMNSYRAGWDRGYGWSAREDMGPKVEEAERVAEQLAHAHLLPGVPGAVEDGREVPSARDERVDAAEAVELNNEAALEWELDRRALGPRR